MSRVGQEKDRMENSGMEFFNRVREGYLKIAQNEPKRIKVINSTKTIDEVFADTIAVVEKYLK